VREARTVRDHVVPDATAAIDPVETARIRCALETLPAAQRDVIIRVYYRNQTLAEVALKSGTPLGTIRSRLAQALRRLHLALSGGS
jgi:RNA polymerase sigma-70 factor, ECF subfamily